jgi:hypothetical protein
VLSRGAFGGAAPGCVILRSRWCREVGERNLTRVASHFVTATPAAVAQAQFDAAGESSCARPTPAHRETVIRRGRAGISLF